MIKELHVNKEEKKSNDSSCIHSKRISLKNRRGVSDIIVTLLLLGVTVTGGALLSTFFLSDDFASQISTAGSSVEGADGEAIASLHSILITGYDARDGNDLSGIAALDNVNDGILCSKTCDGSGTDFIVIKIRNNNPSSIFMEGVSINETLHSYDRSIGGDTLGTSFPPEGTFVIIDPTNNDLTIHSSEEVRPGTDVRLVIRLSGDMNDDIKINKAVRILIDSNVSRTPTLIIKSGSLS